MDYRTQATIDGYRAELSSIISSIVGEKWIYADHVSTLYSGRDRIGVILHELSGKVNTTAIGEALWLPPIIYDLKEGTLCAESSFSLSEGIFPANFICSISFQMNLSSRFKSTGCEFKGIPE